MFLVKGNLVLNITEKQIKMVLLNLAPNCPIKNQFVYILFSRKLLNNQTNLKKILLENKQYKIQVYLGSQIPSLLSPVMLDTAFKNIIKSPSSEIRTKEI